MKVPICLAATFILCGPTFAAAQQRPPTVRNVHPGDVRIPTADEQGLWQLLSHQNDPNSICPAGQRLAVINRTGKVVCWVRMEQGCKEAIGAFRNGLRKAENERAALNAEISREDTHNRNIKERLTAAEIEDRRFDREAANETDVRKKIAIYERQVKHKQEMLTLVRQRDQSDAKLDKLGDDWDRVIREHEEARKNLQRTKEINPSCGPNDQPKGWLAERFNKGIEYALADPQVKELLKDALVSAAAYGGELKYGTKFSDPIHLLHGIETEIKRAQYSYRNGLDKRFWTQVSVTAAELIIKNAYKAHPGAGLKLSLAKFGAAFGTSFVYGFAVAP